MNKDKYDWINDASSLTEQLREFSKYLSEKTMKERGNQGRKRLDITHTSSYLSLTFKVKLDTYTTFIKYPKSERIIQYAADFEKLFKLVLAHVLKTMLKNKKGYNVEYKGAGEIEFVEQEPVKQYQAENKYGQTQWRDYEYTTSAKADTSTGWYRG